MFMCPPSAAPPQNIDVQMDRLQRTWIDGIFVSARESHKQYSKLQAEMEEAEAKYLGLKKVRIGSRSRSL